MKPAIIRVLLLLAMTMIGGPLASEAKHSGMTRIGILWPIDKDPVLDAFLQALRDLGYVEGDNLVYEYRSSGGDDTRLPALVSELVRLDVDVIVTWGVTAGRITKQATAKIPIVNGSMSDPVRAKLVDSLARPGGNLTGLTSANPDLAGKRLQLMKELVPTLSRAAVLATTAPTAAFSLKETEVAARLLGIELQAVVVQRSDELDNAYAAMAHARANAVIVLPDLMFEHHLGEVVRLAANHRLPAMYYSRHYVDAGGLVSYGPSSAQMFRRAAVYVDRILKGEKPDNLPVEQAGAFDLILNMKTARALGLEIPPGILISATDLVE